MHSINILTCLVLAIVFLMITSVVQAAPAVTEESQGVTKDVQAPPAAANNNQGTNKAVQAAPASTDQIQGTIKDALGRPVSGASLVLKSPDEAIMGKTKSDADGHFVFSSVAPGTYAVVAENPGFQASTAIVTVEAGTIAITTLTMTAQEALEVSVIAERLAQARNSLSPKTGGSVYRFDQQDIATLPEGENTSLNHILVQAPGVANDSYGQIHVRGDHANLQYRINGIILPEGITGFGQAFDARIINRIDLLEGALPAQYGYREAGVIEIDTKTNFENGGRVDLYGGSHNTVNPSFEYGGSKGKLSYYLTGSYMGNDLGIENSTGSSNAIHDHTDQISAFGYLSYILTPTTKVSTMFGSYDGWFQIPNTPGQPPFVGWVTPPANPGALTAAGFGNFNSSLEDERNNENNRYGIIALQSSIGPDFDYQVAFVTRYSSIHFTPDPIGDLVFDGVAPDLYRSSFSNGIQGDGSYRLNDAHTIRMGFFANNEDITSDNTSTLFTQDPNTGNVTLPPYQVVDNQQKNGNTLASLYLQDEWKPTTKLTVNYGVRYDRVDAYTEGSQVSPRVGLVYKATPDTTLHAAYARYFTPPPTELVAPKDLATFEGTSNAPQNAINSPVLPERSHYLDAGITQNIIPGLTVGIDGFYKYVRNLIDEGQFFNAPILFPFNYNHGVIYGAELTASYRAGNFAAYGNFARTVNMAKEIVSSQFSFGPDELTYIANHWIHTDHDQLYTVSAGLSYKLWGTELSTDATYGSGLRTGFANTDHVASNVQVNLGARRKFDAGIFGPMEARVAVINALDKVNPIRTGSGVGISAPQYGPRIGFFGGISKLF